MDVLLRRDSNSLQSTYLRTFLEDVLPRNKGGELRKRGSWKQMPGVGVGKVGPIDSMMQPRKGKRRNEPGPRIWLHHRTHAPWW